MIKRMKLNIQLFSISGTPYVDFKDLPDTTSPIDSTNLNTMQTDIQTDIQTQVESKKVTINLLNIVATAPTICATGDIYFNTTDNLLYTATATNTWSTTGTSPVTNVVYIDTTNNKTYYYNGTTLISVGGGNVVNIQVAQGWYQTGVSPTFTFVSWDSTTYTGVISSNLDMTPYLNVGMKVKFTQNSTIKYAFITAITSTQLTLFLGTDYSLNNNAISNSYYSMLKAPYGFPLDKSKWTVTFTDTTQRAQTSPVAGTWYNLGSLSTNLPIGAWDVSHKIWAYFARETTGYSSLFTCISTTNNGASNTKYVTSCAGYGTGIASFGFSSIRHVTITVTSKTTFYFNCMTFDSATKIAFNNNESALLFEAVCAYL